MTKIIIVLILTTALLLSLTLFSEASTTDKECYPLKDILKKENIKAKEACKFLDNFCVFTTENKTEGGMEYTYTTQIPCSQFELYKATYECSEKYKTVYQTCERYKKTRECIISKTKLIKK